MISKSVIVFWSVACLTIFVHLIGKDQGASAVYILVMGLMWTIVVVPTALIGRLFKSQKVYSTNMQLLRGGVLTAVGLITFVIAHASQQTSATKPQNNPLKVAATAQTTNCKVGLAQYQSLATGISYSRAVAILGCEGSELSRSDMAGFRTVMYMWQGNSLAANMNAMFQNDALVSRAQFGLK